MEETGQTVQETPKVQAEQTGENGKNVGMPECETMELIMESRSENEEFARVDVGGTGRYQDRRLRGSDERGDPRIPGTGRKDLSFGDGMGKGAAVFCDGAG